jgi:hypothetical protein
MKFIFLTALAAAFLPVSLSGQQSANTSVCLSATPPGVLLNICQHARGMVTMPQPTLYLRVYKDGRSEYETNNSENVLVKKEFRISEEDIREIAELGAAEGVQTALERYPTYNHGIDSSREITVDVYAEAGRKRIILTNFFAADRENNKHYPASLISLVQKAEEIWTRAHGRAAAPPNFRLPDETTGFDAIAGALISAFDQVDIVALGEWHGLISLDSDLRIAIVRNPDFAKRVRNIVVEFGSTTEQSTLDRYIRGENVSRAQLEQVWKTTTNGVWDSPIYAEFFAAVREVNSKLSADARIRVFGGDPGPGDKRSRETPAVSVLEQQVLQKHGKALVIYGAAHFYRSMPGDLLASMDGIGIARKLEVDFPGRTLVVIPVARLDRPEGLTGDIVPDFQKFDRALSTQVRPVLVPLKRLPFRDFSAEEFLGRTLTNCRGAGGCVSVFQGSSLTLGQMADACVYVSRGADR